MSAMKPIPATPELRGEDAVKVLFQANTKPTEKAIKKNKVLRNVLIDIRQA